MMAAEVRKTPEVNSLQQPPTQKGVDFKQITLQAQAQEASSLARPPEEKQSPLDEYPSLHNQPVEEKAAVSHEGKREAEARRREKYAKNLKIAFLPDDPAINAILETLEETERTRDEFKKEFELRKSQYDEKVREEVKRRLSERSQEAQPPVSPDPLDILTLKQQLREKEDEVDTLKQQIASADEKNSTLRRENLNLRQQLRDKEGKVDDLKQLLSDLRPELERAQEEARFWQQKAIDWEKECRDRDDYAYLYRD